jgi:hypothetical protein
MAIIRKQFSQDLHDQYDNFGRDRIIKYYADNGLELRNNPNQYGVDLIAYDDGAKIGYVEVEVRQSWKENICPFDSLHVPERKKKLLDNDLHTVLVSVNCYGTRAFICDYRIVLASPLLESPNKYIANGEKFYKVDTRLVNLVRLT